MSAAPSVDPAPSSTARPRPASVVALADGGDESPRLTVYYDGACPVCSREIAAYRRQPGAEACAWVDASRCDSSELGPDLSREAALARLHVRRADGTLVDGARGFAALWRALPRTAWLGRIASAGLMPRLLDAGYGGFLRIRRAWRPPAAPWPREVVADLRSDHAGEIGAVSLYEGVLAVARDPALREFARRHLDTEREHLRTLERHLPAGHRSRSLPAWRIAGWIAGALPALFGPRAVHATVAAVERFVVAHYTGQLARLDALPPDRALAALRADLERCRLDEAAHREEALCAGAAQGPAVAAWNAVVGIGSRIAAAIARRI